MDSVLDAGLSNAAAAAVLASVVAAVTRFWRNPFVAHGLWLLVLIKLVTPPLWTVPLPVGMSPEEVVAKETSTALREAPEPANSVIPLETGSVDSPVPFGTDEKPQPIEGPRSRELEAAAGSSNPLSPSSGVVPDADGPPAQMSLAAMDHRPGPEEGRWSVEMTAAVVWMVGSGLLTAVLCAHTFCFGLRVGRVARPDESVEARAQELAERLGLRRHPRVRVVPARIAPAVWCPAWRAMLLVPRCVVEAGRRHLETVLTHELMHVRRLDHRVRQLETLVLLLYWWLPVVWWVVARLRQAEEECCDAEVLARDPQSAHRYAEVLVSTMELLRDSHPAGPAFSSGFGRRNELKRRIEMILTHRPRRSTWGSRLALVLAAFILPLTPGWAESDAKPVEASAKLDGPGPGKLDRPEETTREADESAAVTVDPRRDAPYGELGFPGGDYGPHWEFVRLATHEPVQCEIRATREQQRALQSVYESLMARSGRWSRVEPQLLRDESRRAKEILTDEQEQRIEQIIFQRRGVPAFLQDDVQKKLDLTAQQIERIRSAWEAHTARAKKGWQGDEGREALHGVWKVALDALKDKQRARFAELSGPPVSESKCEPLSFEELVALNQKAHELQQYRDNAFIFDEKVSEFVDEAERKHAGRSICLGGKVAIVSRKDVIVDLVNTSRDGADRIPSIVFLISGEEQPIATATMTEQAFADWKGRAGRNIFSPTAWAIEQRRAAVARSTLILDIGTLVPLEMAKTLRAGDAIEVCADLRDVVVFNDTREASLGFVFINAELSTPEDASRSKRATVVRTQKKEAAMPEPVQMRAFGLQHTKAEDLAKLLQELFGGSDGRLIRFAADARSNRLIVTGSKQQLEIVEAIIQRLDAPDSEK